MDRGEAKGRRCVRILLHAFAAIILTPSSSLTASAAPLRVVELSDPELSMMRGRFVSSGQVQYFGVQMYTQWQTEAGQTYSAGLDVRVDVDTLGAEPQIQIYSTADAGSGLQTVGASDSRTTETGGFDAVQGVGQMIQVVGDGNGIENVLVLDVGGDAPATPSQGQWQEGFTSVTDAASGVTAGTSLGADGVALSVNVPGQGSATQEISSMGIQQAVSAIGDTNQIVNTLNLSVQFRPTALPTTVGLTTTLEHLRGIAP